MKALLIILFFFSANLWAARAAQPKDPDIYLDVLPLQYQMRFEDSNDQQRTYHQYQAYSLGVQYDFFRAELEYSQFYDSSGNASLKIEQTIKELDLGFGYCVYEIADAKHEWVLGAFANLWLGQTQTNVDTKLLGSTSTTSTGQVGLVGIGASLIGRIEYFLTEIDIKALNSKNMNPSTVPIFAAKIGLGFPL